MPAKIEAPRVTASHLDRLTDTYLAHLVTWAPVQACLLGDARGLGTIEPLLRDREAVACELREVRALAARWHAVKEPGNGEEVALLGALLESRLVERTLRPRLFQTHRRPDLPLDLLAESVQQALVWPGLRPPRRRATILAALANVAPVLQATERRLGRSPLPKPWVELALLGVDDASSLLVRDLGRWIARGLLADPDGALAAASAAAGRALERYGFFLAATPTREGGFRAGATVVGRWLKEVEHVPISPRRALQYGRSALRLASQELREAAFLLHPHADPTLTILSLEDDRVGHLIVGARRLVGELRAFCEQRDLVTLPDGPRCKVEAAPEYLAALTQACLDTPGPLQPSAAPTRYLLALPPEHASVEESDLLHRLLNKTTLTWISAHETYPGHHVQHLHLCGNGQALHPLLRVADSETFIEGWAHYSEVLLVEHGFHDKDPKLALGVTWAKVVRLCRLVATLELHCGKASIADAMRIFEVNALMDEQDARREALRAVSDPTVLSYALGRARIEARRLAERRLARRAFSLRRFHDRLLARGNAPIDLRSPPLS